MISALDVSASALVAQRTRMNVIANNVANATTTRNERGELSPFQAKYVTFLADESFGGPDGVAGVKVGSVVTDNKEPRLKYQPYHPDARDDGYVAYPNINLMEQMVDAIEASRAYEANIGVIEVTKNLARETLRIVE